MKRIIAAALLLALLVGSAGCGGSTKRGIGRVGDKEFYTITMTQSERETYFSINGPINQVAVMNYGETGTSIVNWSSVSGGGYIAWTGNRVRYMPDTFTAAEAKTAASTLSSDDDAMSIRTASKYVPQLKGS